MCFKTYKTDFFRIENNLRCVVFVLGYNVYVTQSGTIMELRDRYNVKATLTTSLIGVEFVQILKGTSHQ